MKIAVFGGSKTPVDSADYRQALNFGRELAQSGHTVMTGGYLGTMEAVSRGAFEAGGQVIGVTCAQIESWRSVKPNAYITKEIKFNTLIERLLHLINDCDMAVAMPGGIGTLTEIALAWNLLVVDVNQTPPILLVGTGWEKALRAFYDAQDAYVPVNDRAHLVFCADIQLAMKEIKKYV